MLLVVRYKAKLCTSAQIIDAAASNHLKKSSFALLTVVREHPMGLKNLLRSAANKSTMLPSTAMQ